MSGSNLPVVLFNYLLLSQVWLPTVQDVLQADWQDVWHSPHPPLHMVVPYVLFPVSVFTRFINNASSLHDLVCKVSKMTLCRLL